MWTYRLAPGLPVAAEVRRVAVEQLTRAAHDLDDPDRHEAAHETRKRCKKLRALVRLVRGAAPEVHRTENPALRDAARRLSADRDQAAAVEAFDAFVDHHGDDLAADAFVEVRVGLLEGRDEATDPWEPQRDAVRADLRDVQARIAGWELHGEGFAVLRDGLHRTYRAARQRMADAVDDGGDATRHEWRKQAKYHWHHLQLLRAAWPPVLRVQAAQVHRLTEMLGHERDLAALLARVRDDPDRYGGVEVVGSFGALVERRRGELLAASRTLGGRCFAEPPRAFVDRVERYWTAGS